jgi:hypothetical protein
MEMAARTEAGKRKRYQNRDSLAQSYLYQDISLLFYVSLKPQIIKKYLESARILSP